MLAGTGRYEAQPAHLLDLLRVIKTADITHFGKDPGQDVLSDPPYLQYIGGGGYLAASDVQHLFGICYLPVETFQLCGRPSDRFPAALRAVHQADAPGSQVHDLSRPAVAASLEARSPPYITEAVRAYGEYVLRERGFFEHFQGKSTFYLSECVLIFRKIDRHLPVQTVDHTDPVFGQLVFEP